MVASDPENHVPKILTHDRYILDEDGNPQPMPDLLTWAEWHEHRKRGTDWIVAKTTVGQIKVSTVFLSLDHNHTGIGPPILFETTCFAGKSGEEFAGDEYFDRYATREKAEEGHMRIVQAVKSAVE